MHVTGDTKTRRPRGGAPVLLGLVVLLAVVAVASSGHVPVGAGGTRRPADEVLDTMISLVLVLALASIAGVFYLYYLQRTNSHEERRKGLQGSRRSLMAVIGVVALLSVLAVVAAIHNRTRHRPQAPLGPGAAQASAREKHGNGYTPRFATIPVAVILGATGIAAVAAYLSYRAGRRTLGRLPLDSPLALSLADVLGETLDDLRAEPDPRTAVIAAYARLERTLGAFGLPRRESDAPAEYLRRILVDLDVGARHAARLTQLFEHAKFSPHEVGPEMKEEAIELLVAIRADLHAAEAARAAASDASRAAGASA